jgi:hypothetical protein
MRSHFQTIALSILLLSAVIGVGAQTATNGSKNPINNALNSMADNGSKACDGVDCVISAVQDAKKSNDPKKMKQALDMAEKQLSDTKQKTHKATKIAQVVRDHMEKVDAQRIKVKEEQQRLDALEYPTDEFIIGE